MEFKNFAYIQLIFLFLIPSFVYATQPTKNAYTGVVFSACQPSDTNSNCGGTASNITGLISAGTNITLSGNGTIGTPYVINSSGGSASAAGGTNAVQYNSGSSTFAGKEQTFSFNGTNVGIGTTNGTQPLDVRGTISATTFSGAGTGLTGTAASLTAGTVTTNANLTGPVTSSGNATTISNSINLPANPTTTTQAVGENTNIIATDAFVQAQINNQVDMHDPVQAATTAALILSPTYSNGSSGVGATLTAGTVGVLVIDGYTPVLNDRVLVQNQALSFQNGCYVLTTVGVVITTDYVLTRCTDFNQVSNINYGVTFPVLQGTANTNQQFTMNNNAAITVGTTAITFAQTSGGSQLSQGTNIVITGNSIATTSNPAFTTLTTTGNVGIGTISTQAPLSVITGNVGIGTWSPAQLVDIIGGNLSVGTPGSIKIELQSNGNFFATSLLNINSGSNSTISPTANGTTISRNVADSNVALTVTQTNSSSTGDIVDFKNNSSIVASVLQTGNVGIGTSNAKGGLVVTNGNVGIGTWVPSGALVVQAGNVGFGTYAPQGALEVENGNVGIGTSGPVVSLDVNGTARLNGGWYSTQGVPTINTCSTGGTCTIGSGSSDYDGNIGIGTISGTTMIANFAHTFSVGPFCNCGATVTSGNVICYADTGTTTTLLHISVTPAQTSKTFNYHCGGH